MLRDNRVALWVIAALASACGASGFEPRSPAELDAAREAIAAVLDDWHAAAADADETRYFGHMARDAVFLGTDATERWTRPEFRAYAHPHFERGDAWTFRSVRRAITLHPSGRLAWFDEDLETENLGPARGSGVLRLEPDGVWRLVQYNLAITVPNDRFGAVRALLREAD